MSIEIFGVLGFGIAIGFALALWICNAVVGESYTINTKLIEAGLGEHVIVDPQTGETEFRLKPTTKEDSK